MGCECEQSILSALKPMRAPKKGSGAVSGKDKLANPSVTSGTKDFRGGSRRLRYIIQTKHFTSSGPVAQVDRATVS
jgi:hypothetical protein